MRRPAPPRHWGDRRDLAAIAVLVAGALAWCLPGLLRGGVFGSFDLALHFGLTQGLYAGVHNGVDGDTARQGAVWAALNWQAVHAGRLPLWDPAIVLGLPLLANVQSAPFSLPSLVSYVVPLADAYTTIVIVKLVLGGIGCYVAARVLGFSRRAALLAGAVGELAGPMAAWAGWPQTGVAEWTGWLIAAIAVVVRRPGRNSVAALAVVVAFAIAGGFPEVAAVLAIAAVVFGAAVTLRPERDGASGRWRGAGALGLGTLAGIVLAAPAWLPAVPVLERAVTLGRLTPSLPAGEPWLFLDPFYFGSPLSSGVWFGPANYYETAAFVGPLVLVLALVALLRRFGEGPVLGLGVAAVICYLLGSDLSFVIRAENALPLVRSIAFGRGLLVCCDLLGLLAAAGLDALLGKGARAAALAWLGGAVPVALVLAATLPARSLPAPERAARLDGAVIAAVLLGALGVVVAVRLVWPGRVRLAGLLAGIAVLGELASLVGTSAPFASWGERFFPSTPALAAVRTGVAGGLVALGGQHAPGDAVHLGVLADLNAVYGLRELAGYDAMIPRALERAWARSSPAPDLAAAEVGGVLTSFVPDVTTRAQAAALGVSAVLEPLRLPVRLVDGAAARLAGVLRRAGAPPSASTGVLDALEWLTEQPGLLHDYPVARPGAVAAYLEALAHQAVPLAPPTAVASQAAAEVAPRLSASPQLASALAGLFTTAPPTGAVPVVRAGGEELWRFVGLKGATVLGGHGAVTAPLRYRDDATAAFGVTTSRAAWVRLGIDDEPGWSASAGGQPLATRSGEGGAVLEVRVPAGVHRVVLTYWPAGLSAALAAAAAVIVAGLVALGLGRRRRGRIPAAGERRVPVASAP
ncbi:MAG: hypothetical protein M0004_00865 [Actinomycetota bacterium]|nr:hypothetical protein [Actinomycetota bacterium]